MAAFTSKDGEKLAITINVSQSFFEGSGASWATSVPQDATLDEINEITDRMMGGIQRQETWARISGLNNDLEAHAKQKAQLEFSLASLEKRHGDKAHIPQDVRAAREQGEESLLRIKILMEALEQEQTRLRKGLK
jgi:hypothetical protein